VLGDFVPGYETSTWFGLGAPRNTPAAIIEVLNRETNAALADPKMKQRLADLGGMMLTGSAAEFGKLIADETEKWAKVVKFANIKPE
jgi:tripartite-type tricarboxylate transporter receptor subunit TctC